MQRFAFEAWGELGTNAVLRWSEFNDRFFGGALRPIPLVISNTQPFGHLVGFCNDGGDRNTGRTITLNVPHDHRRLLADNCTLLHEMIHQYLHECGEDAKHKGDGWRREIMRLNKLITGNDIWAGEYTTARVDVGEATKRVKRINKPHPNGQKSLNQMQIARWPHDRDIQLGELGC
jgi:hypothetical protein